MRRVGLGLSVVLASVLPGAAAAGEVCALGPESDQRVCCASGCSEDGLGCAIPLGNYLVGDTAKAGLACPDLADRPDADEGLADCDADAGFLDDGTSRFADEPDGSDPELPLCDLYPSEDAVLARVSQLSTHLAGDVVQALQADAEGWAVGAAEVQDAIAFIEGVSATGSDGAAAQLAEGRYEPGFGGLTDAVDALKTATEAGALAERSIERVMEVGFLMVVVSIDEGVIVGVDAEEVASAWASYDEAVLRWTGVDSDPTSVLEVLGLAAGFGKGTKTATSKANARPQLL